MEARFAAAAAAASCASSSLQPHQHNARCPQTSKYQSLPTTTPAGYERRFRELAAALAARFPGAPLHVTSEGTPKATGWFEVLVDGLLVFSKKNGGAWVAAVLAPSCGRASKCAALRPSPLSVLRRAETQHINYNCFCPAAHPSQLPASFFLPHFFFSPRPPWPRRRLPGQRRQEAACVPSHRAGSELRLLAA